MQRSSFKNVHRVVVKVGTGVITDSKGELDLRYIQRIVKQIIDLQKDGKEVLLVTSGAIGAGKKLLGLRMKVRELSLKQACAAVGQSILMHAYEGYFQKYNKIIAQILLTQEDLSDRMRYLHLHDSLNKLLELNVIPIINENDTVSTHELEPINDKETVTKINFSDNDKLSALVSSKVEADLLIILSDVDGLYEKDPRDFKNAKLISTVEEITPKIERIGGKAGAGGRGGMYTKIQAAKIATSSGVTVVIVNGRERDIIRKVMAGDGIGTIFTPKKRLSSRAGWIAFASSVKGVIQINEGAKGAIENKGSSLLPAGIINCKGDFSRGDVVSIQCDAEVIAKGLVNYSANEISKIKGLNTRQIEEVLGYKRYKEVVRREDMVMS